MKHVLGNIRENIKIIIKMKPQTIRNFHLNSNVPSGRIVLAIFIAKYFKTFSKVGSSDFSSFEDLGLNNAHDSWLTFSIRPTCDISAWSASSNERSERIALKCFHFSH